LTETLGYFSAIEGKLDQMEYYQERRLRCLNLLDRDGKNSYDPFEDTTAAEKREKR
jgi:[ribulose-bisphosphate carboxylase]-lysine N-methyltransferase|tara:strand:+ start:2330 stop:2497 length:168 start_codon:yes stop_codon:yes gene_type:complete